MILVTGAQGFVGRAVCAQLERQRLPHAGTDLPCDISRPAAVAELFEAHRIEAVIHLATLLRRACLANPAQAARVNVMGSINLLERAAQSGVRRFVFASSISVYEPADLYGAGKRYVEVCGEALARAAGISFVALRIATVVGAGARHTASPWRTEIFEKMGTGERQRIGIPFNAEAALSLLHVEDAARMLILAATQPGVPLPVYDTPGERWTAGELKQKIESLDGNVTVDLDSAGQPAPPVADGAHFARDFGWQAPRLADRMAERLLE